MNFTLATLWMKVTLIWDQNFNFEFCYDGNYKYLGNVSINLLIRKKKAPKN